MSHPSAPPQETQGHAYTHDLRADEAEQDDFKPLTREQAQQWRMRQTKMSVWQVVKWQLAMTALVTLGAALVTQQAPVVWSVLYGALCVLLPTALMAHGLTSSALTRWLRSSRPHTARVSLAVVFFWEGVKILLALAMLWSAPRWVADLSWLGLLVGLVVVLKAYWLVFWWRGSRRSYQSV